MFKFIKMIKDFLIQKVFAAQVPSTEIKPGAFEGITTLNGLVTVIVNAIIIIGAAVVIIFLAMGFISFITSQGDKIKAEQAQKWVTYAIIGGIGLFAVFVLRNVIFNLIGWNDVANY